MVFFGSVNYALGADEASNATRRIAREDEANAHARRAAAAAGPDGGGVPEGRRGDTPTRAASCVETFRGEPWSAIRTDMSAAVKSLSDMGLHCGSVSG